jgi:hypothetical protein
MSYAFVRFLGVALWFTTTAPATAVETHAAPSLLATIELWLATNFALSPAKQPPDLVRVSAARLVEIRYGSVSAVAPGDVVAAYDDSRRTIYLGEDWSGRSPGDISVLVHEMVHHLQASADMRFACPAEREVLAYRAQDAWLRLFGTNLKNAFGIDSMMLLVATACTH